MPTVDNTWVRAQPGSIRGYIVTPLQRRFESWMHSFAAKKDNTTWENVRLAAAIFMSRFMPPIVTVNLFRANPDIARHHSKLARAAGMAGSTLYYAMGIALVIGLTFLLPGVIAGFAEMAGLTASVGYAAVSTLAHGLTAFFAGLMTVLTGSAMGESMLRLSRQLRRAKQSIEAEATTTPGAQVGVTPGTTPGATTEPQAMPPLQPSAQPLLVPTESLRSMAATTVPSPYALRAQSQQQAAVTTGAAAAYPAGYPTPDAALETGSALAQATVNMR